MANDTLSADCADIWEALGRPTARFARLAADVEAREESERLERCSDSVSLMADLINDLDELVGDAPDVASKLKHDDECHKRHVACLASHVRKILAKMQDA